MRMLFGEKESVMTPAVEQKSGVPAKSPAAGQRVVWDEKQEPKLRQTLSGHTDTVHALAVLPDGSLASGSSDLTIKIWNPVTGECRRTLSGHTSYVSALAVLPDGSLASGSYDKTIKIWNPLTGECRHTLSGHMNVVSALAVLPDGGLASGSWNKTIKIWNPMTGECRRTLNGHTSDVSALAVLPDGSLASGSSDPTIKIWNPSTGECRRTLSEHTSTVYSLAVLSDGSLASGSGPGDCTIKIWNPVTGECRRTLSGHTYAVNALAVLPDGSLASGSGDYTIKIWNPLTGECRRTLSGHMSPVLALAVLPDGSLASGSYDKTIQIHNMPYRPLETMKDRVETVIPKPLTMGSPSAPESTPKASNVGLAVNTKLAIDAAQKSIVPKFTPAVQQSPLVAEQKALPSAPVGAKDEKSLISVSFEIPYSELTIGKKLGQGGYGAVYQASWKYDQVAVKQLLISHLSDETREEFKAEATIMARLRSRFTVQFYGYCTKPEYCMVMEYMPKGSLYNLLHSKETLDWSVRYKIVTDIACGLAFLHSSHVFHRDLKSLNVLLDENYRAKLCDFGLSKVKSETRSSSSKGGAVGTLAWMAPELLDQEAHFTASADVYSMGVTFWEVASRKIPFATAINPHLIPIWTSQGKREKIPDDCPPKLASLIKFCWQTEPSKRPTAAEVADFLRSDRTEFSDSATAIGIQGNFDSIGGAVSIQGNLSSGTT